MLSVTRYGCVEVMSSKYRIFMRVSYLFCASNPICLITAELFCVVAEGAIVYTQVRLNSYVSIHKLFTDVFVITEGSSIIH
jgi:hypothetical protein